MKTRTRSFLIKIVLAALCVCVLAWLPSLKTNGRLINAEEGQAINEITTSQTLSGTLDAVKITGGLENEPLILTVDGTLLVNGTISISDGSFVTIKGDGNDIIKRTFSDASFFDVPNGANLTVENLTVDGGAVWSGNIDELLNRGIVNAGVFGGNMFKYEGNVTINNCTLQNHDGDFVCSSSTDHNPDNTLSVAKSKVINNNGGVSWSRDTVNFSETEISYNSGSPSVFRPCGASGTRKGSEYYVNSCNIHHNKGNYYGVIAKWQSEKFEIRNTTISNNTATTGAAFYNAGANAPHLYDCTITNNTASEAGGAFFITSNNGMRVHGRTVISGNSSPKGSAVYTDKWFILEGDYVGEISNNTGSAAIYLGNGSNLEISGTNNFSGNDGDLYVNEANGISIGGTVNDVSVAWSSTSNTPISVGSPDILDKLNFNGNVSDDTVKLPFIRLGGNSIEFVTVKLNGGSVMDYSVSVENTLATPVKNQNVFLGWYKQNGVDSTNDEDWGEIVQTVSSSETYYARWQKSNYVELSESERTLDFGIEPYGYDVSALNSKSLTFIYNGALAQRTGARIESVYPCTYFTTAIDGLTLNIKPIAGLTIGAYEENITVTMHDGSTTVVNAKLIVDKREIVIDWANVEFTYNGEIQSSEKIAASYKDVNGETIALTVELDGEFKNADKYLFTASFANGETFYKLPSNPTNYYVIKKAQVAKPVADKTSFVYTGAELTYNVEASELYDVTGLKRKEIGSQDVIISLKDTLNYEWADGTTDNIVYTFTVVAPAVIDTPDQTTADYDWLVWTLAGVLAAEIICAIVLFLIFKNKNNGSNPNKPNGGVKTASVAPVFLLLAAMPTNTIILISVLGALVVAGIVLNVFILTKINKLKQQAIDNSAVVATQDITEEQGVEKERPVDNGTQALAGFDRSLTAKLIQSHDVTKELYCKVKNELLSVKGVNCKMFWQAERFTVGKKLIAKFTVRGKTLTIHLPLNPTDYATAKFKVMDMSGTKRYIYAPLGYKIRSERAVKNACKLIHDVTDKLGLTYTDDGEKVDTGHLFVRDHQALMEEGLIRERK